MTTESKTYQEFVEDHIRLLHALSDALEAGSVAVVSLRLHDFEDRLNEQKGLCMEINSLHAEIRRKFPLVPSNQESLRDAAGLRHRWHEARSRLRQLNYEQQSLIQRAGRTANALLNAFRSFEGNYAAQALQQTSRRASLQERP